MIVRCTGADKCGAKDCVHSKPHEKGHDSSCGTWCYCISDKQIRCERTKETSDESRR